MQVPGARDDEGSTPPSGRRPDGPGLSRADGAFVALTAAFSVVLVLTNLIGVKLFLLFPDGRPSWFPGEGSLTLTSGILTYPLTFLITDLVSELWGHKKANFMVILGFGMSLLMLAVVSLARALPPSPFWEIPQMGLGYEGKDLNQELVDAIEKFKKTGEKPARW